MGPGDCARTFITENHYMHTNLHPLESLLASAEQCNKTTLDLVKLKSVYLTTNVASTVFPGLLLTIVFSFFALTLTVAVSFWLGSVLGEVYYGFFAVALVYGVTGMVLFLCYPMIKKRVGEAVINHFLN
jgi:hypothetical protein